MPENPKPHGNNGWTFEDIDRLRELIKTGATSAQIAAHFPGKTRNAVLGKAFRLGLRLVGAKFLRSYESFWSHGDNLRELAGYLESPLGYSQAEIARCFNIGEATVRRGMDKLSTNSVIPLKPNAASIARRALQRVVRVRPAAAKAPAIIPDATPPTPILIGDLTSHTCRWPVEGEGYQMLYCGGHALEGRPYCAAHCRMAYQR